jgi:hypothetical protein
LFGQTFIVQTLCSSWIKVVSIFIWKLTRFDPFFVVKIVKHRGREEKILITRVRKVTVAAGA